MSQKFQHTIEMDLSLVKLLRVGGLYSHCAFFITSETEFTAAIGAKYFIEIPEAKGGFDQLEAFQKRCTSRIAGYLGYDLKNDLEDLNSKNSDPLEMPESVFFEPKLWLSFAQGELKIDSGNQKDINDFLIEFERRVDSENNLEGEILIQPQTSRSEYLAQANIIKAHLQRGDIYEANYCMQFSGKAESLDPVSQFLKLLNLTRAPFSVFSKLNDKYILSASPERYLKNTGGELISQPIKGTIKRSENLEEDQRLIAELKNDPKEQSENVMIVDLVRNDLSRIATRDSVRVKELFGVTTFKTVHHLISTVTAQLNTEKHDHWDAIKASFPMGSMTGAPKISAMKIIDSCESFKRGVYSGAFGWMDPDGDFDFNVLIRTLIYNQTTRKIGFSVGSAITINAIPEKEYDECMLKAEAIIQSLKAHDHEIA